MDKQSLLNSLNKASFKTNKRYHDAEKTVSAKSLLIKIHEMQDSGDHDRALELISEARLEKPESIDNHPHLLLAESISCIAIDKTDRALESLSKAELLFPNYSFSGRDDRDYLVSRNISSVHVNKSTCFIMMHDYISAITHALIARNEYSQWHGPHIALFSSLLRITKSEQCGKKFTIPDNMSDDKVREANHDFLTESIKKMVNDWPNWNSDRALLSHLMGDNSTAADTDLVGMIEIIEDLGYSLNEKK